MIIERAVLNIRIIRLLARRRKYETYQKYGVPPARNFWMRTWLEKWSLFSRTEKKEFEIRDQLIMIALIRDFGLSGSKHIDQNQNFLYWLVFQNCTGVHGDLHDENQTYPHGKLTFWKRGTMTRISFFWKIWAMKLWCNDWNLSNSKVIYFHRFWVIDWYFVGTNKTP